MSKGGKKGKRGRLRKLATPRTSGRSARRVDAREWSLQKEVDHILRCARQGDSRAIAFGVLLFFSTSDGDAWVLDIEDASALCLMKQGEPRPVTIEETNSSFAIGWEGSFTIEGDSFIVNDGLRTTLFGGYPTAAIEDAMRVARAALSPP